MRKTLLAAAQVLMIAVAPNSSQADSVGAAFGAGTGLVVAGPIGAVAGGVIRLRVWGHPFWGPPISPRACWIDNYFYRHCRYYDVGGTITELRTGEAARSPLGSVRRLLTDAGMMSIAWMLSGVRAGGRSRGQGRHHLNSNCHGSDGRPYRSRLRRKSRPPRREHHGHVIRRRPGDNDQAASTDH